MPFCRAANERMRMKMDENRYLTFALAKGRLANKTLELLEEVGPNISPKSEYEKRKSEQLRLIDEMKTKYPVSFIDCDYDYDEFLNIAKGYEACKEGGERCFTRT